MKNKLLLSSALLGSLVTGSLAQAQTTVSGSLAVTYKAHTDMTQAVDTARGMGRESQINVQSKGKLNNGMDYAAGFSLEFDGGQTQDASNENVYVDFISGNTTLTFGVDHIQNSNRTRGILVGNDAQDLHHGSDYAASSFLQTVGSDPAQSMGFGVMQKTPVGTFSALYVPTQGNAGLNDLVTQSGATAQGSAGAQSIQGTGESAYEIGFVGDLGVKGLSAHAFINKRETLMTERAAGSDLKGTNIGASYQFGAVTAGYNYKKSDGGTTSGRELTQDEFGLAYQVTPNLSLGASYTKMDTNEAAKVDAKSKGIAIGYNLGPVAATAQYSKGENVTNSASTDQDVMYLRLTTNF